MANKALVVGINAYGGSNELPSCVQDAHAISDLLRKSYRFDDITLLCDREASKDAVLRSLRSLCSTATADDRLVFFYSGHGYQPVVNGEMREALVSQDGQFLDDVDVSTALSTVPDGVLTLVLDTCFSGGLEKVFILDPFGQVRHVGKAKYWRPAGTAEDRLRQVEQVTGFRDFATLPPSHSKGFVSARPGATITNLTLPSSKGLLMSAAQANETASASTPDTKGLSAFTFCLIDSLEALGRDTSAASLVMRAGDKLHGLGVPQTPALKQPITPPNLGDRTFITLAPAGRAKSLDVVASNDQRPGHDQRSGMETPSMINYASPNGFRFNDGFGLGKGFDASAVQSAPQLDKAWYDAIASIVSAVVPAVIPVVANAVAKKGYEAGAPLAATPAPQLDKAWYDTIASIVSAVVPAVIPVVANAVAKKGYEAGAPFAATSGPQPDKAWYDAIANIVSTIVPAVIPVVANAVAKKGYEAGAPLDATFAPHLDKAWYDAVANIVSTVVPAVIPLVANAVAKKGYEASLTGTPLPPHTDKAWYDTIEHIVSTVVPVIMPVIANAVAKKGYDAGPGGAQLPPHLDKAWYDSVLSAVKTVAPIVAPIALALI